MPEIYGKTSDIIPYLQNDRHFWHIDKMADNIEWSRSMISDELF